MTYPTELERYQLNPHGLDAGDVVILPTGARDEIVKAGFEWGRLKRHEPHKLKDLRPFVESEAGKPSREQLPLL